MYLDIFVTLNTLFEFQAVHVIGQVSECNEKLKENDEAYYKCLWSDCKVYNMASCSMSWLEKHVPIHGGKFSYPCIVSGCKMRFSSQVRGLVYFSNNKNNMLIVIL